MRLLVIMVQIHNQYVVDSPIIRAKMFNSLLERGRSSPALGEQFAQYERLSEQPVNLGIDRHPREETAGETQPE